MRSFFSTAKWWFWLILAGGAVFLLFFLRAIGSKGSTGDSEGKLMPSIPEPILRKVEAAEETALTVRAETRAVTAIQKETLKRITKEIDGRKRREQLADFLNTL